MKTLTFEEIYDYLTDNIDVSDFSYLESDTSVDSTILGKIEKVYHYGGEDKGSDYVTVQHFVDHDVYVRLRGWYSSYEGVDYSGYDYENVKPKEKIITVYE